MPATSTSPCTRSAFFIATAADLTASVQPLLDDGNVLLQFTPDYVHPHTDVI